MIAKRGGFRVALLFAGWRVMSGAGVQNDKRKGRKMKWFLQRLSEPSTWAGFAGLLPAVFSVVQQGVTPAGIGGVVAGVAAVLMKEGGRV